MYLILTSALKQKNKKKESGTTDTHNLKYNYSRANRRVGLDNQVPWNLEMSAVNPDLSGVHMNDATVICV
jgi:hypothetical protein